MRAYSSMPVYEFVQQLRDIAIDAPMIKAMLTDISNALSRSGG